VLASVRVLRGLNQAIADLDRAVIARLGERCAPTLPAHHGAPTSARGAQIIVPPVKLPSVP
jgi:hypothetical protein